MGNRYVITGGTSGIGRGVVARLLAGSSDRRIILFARPSPRVDHLRALPGANERLSVVDGNLASLRSIDLACDEVASIVGSDPIEVLGMNAGVQVVRGNASSADGLELSFAVNFLAHFLIVERLKGLLRPGGRIVITSSEVHDPDAFCLMGIGRARWQDPLMLADPKRSQDHVPSTVNRGEARYCASKLLCLMYVRHLARVLPDIGVMAFNPSVVPGTEIGRDRNWLQQVGWKYVLPLLTPLLPGARSLNRSVSDLLWLLTEADGRRLSGHYVDGRVVRSGSEDSRDQVKIVRTIEVANSLLARALASTRSGVYGHPTQLSAVAGWLPTKVQQPSTSPSRRGTDTFIPGRRPDRSIAKGRRRP
jgi:NAD(P)-dependent dehydrogenase (short-subunit alcohol dehydrogenase family)